VPHYPKPFFKKARRCWYVEIDRRQVKLGPDRDEAFRTYHQLMAEPKKKQVAGGSLAAIVDAFLEWSQQNRSPDTYEWYRYRLERFVRQYPDLRVTELRPYHVETWAASYNLSRTSRRNYLRSVKRCLKWARRQGYIDVDPIADLEVPSGERREGVVTPEDFERILRLARSPDFCDLLIVTWETGCRPQESLKVEARHVDLENQRWVFPRSESKMKRLSRVVYMTERAMEITRRLVTAYPKGPLFRNKNGKGWTTEAVNCAFSYIQARMGKEEMASGGLKISPEEIQALIPQLRQTRLSEGVEIPKTAAELRCEAKRKLTQRQAVKLAPHFSLYALRHSWATHALQRGVDPLTVAILMGHEDPSTLSKVYQHLSLDPAHMLKQAQRAVS
jgi:integrase